MIGMMTRAIQGWACRVHRGRSESFPTPTAHLSPIDPPVTPGHEYPPSARGDRGMQQHPLHCMPLLVIALLLPSGCAHLTWTTSETPIGKAHKQSTELDDPEIRLSVTADESEALALLVEVRQRKRIDTLQDLKVVRLGHWTDGRERAVPWLAGAGAFGAVFGFIALSVLWSETSPRPDEAAVLGRIAGIGAGSLSVPGLINLLSEVLPPVRRRVPNRTAIVRSQEISLPLRGSADVSLEAGKEHVADVHVGGRGGAVYELKWDKVAAGATPLVARLGGAQTQFSLIGTRVHLRSLDAALTLRLASDSLPDVHDWLASQAVAEGDRAALWSSYCGVVLKKAKKARISDGLPGMVAGVPADHGPCSEAAQTVQRLIDREAAAAAQAEAREHERMQREAEREAERLERDRRAYELKVARQREQVGIGCEDGDELRPLGTTVCMSGWVLKCGSNLLWNNTNQQCERCGDGFNWVPRRSFFDSGPPFCPH